MVWYVPPLSPISAAANAGPPSAQRRNSDVKQLRIPVKYLANLLTAGDTVSRSSARSNACSPCAPTSAPSTSTGAALNKRFWTRSA